MQRKFISLGLVASVTVQILTITAIIVAFKNGDLTNARHFVLLFWICLTWMKVEQNSIKLDNIEDELTVFDMDLIDRRKLFTYDKYANFVDSVFENMKFTDEDDEY